MQNYWCENCDHRWQSDEYQFFCPECKDVEIRKTMSKEQAIKLNLTEE